jgi:serine/threonine protein kinase
MDLRNFLQGVPEGQFLSPDCIKSLMYQTISGIQACHIRRIVHRDLKPANILLTGALNDIVKIADFGLARAFSIPIKPYTKDVVTLWYRAPELLLKIDEYATPIDIWAAGCIFAELACKDSMFKGRNEVEQISEIFRIMGLPSEQTWAGITQNAEFKAV